VLVVVGSSDAQTPTGTVARPFIGSCRRARGRGTHPPHQSRQWADTKSYDFGEGAYSAAALPPGVYRVTAEATGLVCWNRTVIVETGATTTVNLTLQVGELSEQVDRG